MILELIEQTTEQEAKDLQARLTFMGFQSVLREKEGALSIAVVKGVNEAVDFKQFEILPNVKSATPFTHQYKLASNDFKPEPTIINIKGQSLGRGHFFAMAGPCAVESREQMMEVARLVSEGGATILRGGAFKPRTSPYDFQGLGEEGLRYMREAADAYNMLCVSEVIDGSDVPLMAKYVDILQIGSRNMQNFSLLKQAAKSGKPVLLKRGFSATYVDFLMAAEYLLSEGNPNVILCERGIRTFETHTRNTLDLAAVPSLQSLTHLPIIIDPSHGTGIRSMVPVMARAAAAAGADGLMIEVHPDPDKALSDAMQTITGETFRNIMKDCQAIREVLNHGE